MAIVASAIVVAMAIGVPATAQAAGSTKSGNLKTCLRAATSSNKATAGAVRACKGSGIAATKTCPTGATFVVVKAKGHQIAVRSGSLPVKLPKGHRAAALRQICHGPRSEAATTTTAAPAATTVPTTTVPPTTLPPPTTTVPPTTTPPTTTPPTVPPTTAAPVGCHPLTDGGNCYSPGEYCRDATQGVSGTAGNGEAIECETNDGWRWEPV